MTKLEAKINPVVLKWARDTINVSADEVVNAINKKSVTKQTIYNWEQGIELPSIADAKKLAKLYGLHLAVFYLPKLPEKMDPIKDFRAKSQNFSKAFTLLMREIQNKQEWLEDYLSSHFSEALPFVNSLTIDTPVDKAVETIKSFFDFESDSDQKNDYGTLLKKRIAILEAKGIYVFHGFGINSRYIVDPEEVRGFAISSPFAPVIYINSKDYPSAKLFTLFHELVHIMLGESAVSDVSFDNKNRMEVFCNAVTAELLLPSERFRSLWKSPSSIYEISKMYHVSSIVVLIRAFYFKLIQKTEFENLKKRLKEETLAYTREKDKKQKESNGNPHPYLLKAIFNGKKYTRLVMEAYSHHRLVVNDLYYLLNVKVDKIDEYLEKGKIYQ